jgi:hypothetical protein
MDIENKIVYVFNKYLIQFFKEIKKDDYLKIAIKKNYKMIDKSNSKYVNEFMTYLGNNVNTELFIKKYDNKEDLLKLLEQEELLEMKIFKNITLKRLNGFYSDDKDKLLMYFNTFFLLSNLYNESVMLKEDFLINKKEREEKQKRKENVEKDVEDILEEDEDNDEEDKNEEDNDKKESDEEDNDEKESDEEITLEMEYAVLQKGLDDLLVYCLKVINRVENSKEPEEGIMDDIVENIIHNISLLGISIDNTQNEKVNSILEESKIGKLAKEISESIDLSGIDEDKIKNIKNPMDILQNSNFMGDIINQVGSTITNKMSSGELNQEDLVKDAFSLMGGLQNDIGNNPLFSEMFSNLNSQTSHKSSGNEGNDDMMSNMMNNMGNMGDIFKNLSQNLNMNDIQQMQNAMGGSSGVNQNNPNSREGKMRKKLQKKLNEKN